MVENLTNGGESCCAQNPNGRKRKFSKLYLNKLSKLYLNKLLSQLTQKHQQKGQCVYLTKYREH